MNVSGKNLFHLISQGKSNRKETLSNSSKGVSRFILPNISDLAKVILTETCLFPSSYSLHCLQVWDSVHQTFTAARQISQDLRLGPLNNPVLRRLFLIQTYKVTQMNCGLAVHISFHLSVHLQVSTIGIYTLNEFSTLSLLIWQKWELRGFCFLLFLIKSHCGLSYFF